MVSEEYQLGLVVRNTPMTSFQDLMDTQKELLCLQINELQNVVLSQCELTGVNPLSEEMAAGSLSIKIGKRPRDLLNSKAVKYMLSVFSIKDAVSKKESRDIGALLGITATQVREFFTNQRSRVRKFAGLSREKAIRVAKVNEQQNGVLGSSEPQMPINPVPLNTIVPLASEEPSCSTQPEAIGLNDLEKSFVEKIFMLMRIEETFSGQVKLLEWILQIENSMILLWFLNEGGVMILATWLSLAAIEEQTSILQTILKVLCHLPVNKALPVHMSAILQSVNGLRFYRATVISNRARVLLARWSKVFARSRSLRKVNGSKSVADVESEVLLKKSIEEVMDDESWEAQAIKEDALVPLSESSELRKLEPLKLLTSSTDDSNKKLCLGISSYQTKERRKVLLVEHPGQKLAGRNIQNARSTQKNQSRPLSADDIQKAKMRAHFLRNKYGKSVVASNDGPQTKAEEAPSKCSSFLVDTSSSESIPLIPLRTDEQKQPLPEMLPTNPPTQEVQNEDKLSLDQNEPQLKKRKRMQIPWLTPAEVRMNTAWRFGTGEDSKEVEFQTNRNRRERETIYSASHEIPPNPKEPWDMEMDYDDSLTPEIPSTQLPDNDVAIVVEEETAVSETVAMIDSSRPSSDLNEMVSALASAFALTGNNSSISNSRSSGAEPDYDLLEVLLQTPDLVFALTSGQSGISNEETVRVLDMIKARRAAAAPTVSSPTPTGLGRSGNSILPVSLPSPTPSSEPVTNQWGGEDSRNPFSSNVFQSSNMVHHQNQSAPFIPQQFDHLLNMNNNIANSHNYGNIIIDPSSEPLQQYHQKQMMPTWQMQTQTQNSWGADRDRPNRRYEHIQNRDNVHAGYGGGWEREDFNGRPDYDNNNTNNNNLNRRRMSQADAEYNHRYGYSSHDRRHHRLEPEQDPPSSRNWASSSPDHQQRDQYNNNNINNNRYGDRRWHDGRR
ncbi:homeobox protein LUMINIDEPENDENS [Impatiens glandulifera]|uniref:homeobox protein LUMINIDEPENDENS n=1 Tax=Impatiens glandulifera TaxID=253017 RepID=UPI001FB0AA03|nr:homeobox protein LUMINIDEPENDENS [Impatiens glandulifera]